MDRHCGGFAIGRADDVGSVGGALRAYPKTVGDWLGLSFQFSVFSFQ
jgi:hypothetical protein